MTTKEYNLAVDEYADNVFRFVVKHLGNEMSAKDVVQETFTKVWIKRDDIDYKKVKSYLFTAAYNTMLDWIKKENLKSRMRLQVHDELVFDAHQDEIEILRPQVEDLMKGALPLEVPMEIEIGLGHNWLEAH